MNANFLFRFSPAVMRVSSGFSLILVSNFKDDLTKGSILWSMSLSLGISGFLFGPLGEHFARKYYRPFVSLHTSVVLILVSVGAIFADSTQIVSQTLLLSVLALYSQISRIERSVSILTMMYFCAAARIILPIIVQQNLLFLLSSCYLLIYALHSFVLKRSNVSIVQNQQKSTILGASALALIWFMIQQSFTFLILYKSKLNIDIASHLIVIIRVFEVATQPSAFQAYDAPNYLETMSRKKLNKLISKGVLIQLLTSMILVLLLVANQQLEVITGFQLPLIWIFAASTSFVLVSYAFHCTPTLIRIEVPNWFYFKIICETMIIQFVCSIMVMSGQILLALLIFSFNYNYVYFQIKRETLKVFCR